MEIRTQRRLTVVDDGCLMEAATAAAAAVGRPKGSAQPGTKTATMSQIHANKKGHRGFAG
ncbi:unnamed protein product, partial [Ectocarpus fasciculatus]